MPTFAVDVVTPPRIGINNIPPVSYTHLSGRSDDNLETIKSRLDVYHTQTAPLADYYVGEGKHVAIKGMGTIEEIFGRIKEAVNNVK